MKAYKLLARPVLSYGKGAWTIRKQDEWRLRSAQMILKNAGYFLLFRKRNKLITEEFKKSTHSRIPTTVLKKLVAACKSKETFWTTKSNVPLRLQRKTVQRETSIDMAGDCNRPLGLLLQRKMMILCIKNHLRLHKFISYKSSVLIKQFVCLLYKTIIQSGRILHLLANYTY
jgi:hypothetical protein